MIQQPKLNLLGKMLHFGEIPKKNGEIWRKFSKVWPNLGKFAKFWKKTANNSAIFNENFEIRERCKGVHCVDLGESFPTSIYLQKSASIQPRTSPSKFGGKIQFNIHFTPQPTRFHKATPRRSSRTRGRPPRSWTSSERPPARALG